LVAKKTTAKPKSASRKPAGRAAKPAAKVAARTNAAKGKSAAIPNAKPAKPIASASKKPVGKTPPKAAAAPVPPPKPKRHPITIIDKKAQAAKAAKAAGKAVGTPKTVDKIIGGKNKKPRTVAEAASQYQADAKGYIFINGRRVRMISTKNHVPSKKPKANGTAEVAKAEEQISIKSIKTKLSKPELNHYRELLVLKRRELVGDLTAMESEALRSGGGNLSHMPIHMADIGTDTFDQDFTLKLAANERGQLREIDDALRRIEDKSYGVCQLSGKPIPKSRLDAKPWAKYTIESARHMEGQMSA
jgi:DnaK suppressor protein